MPSNPERRRHKRAADKLGISVEDYEAQLAAQTDGETIEDDAGETAGPKAGTARKAAAKPRKTPRVGKSELFTRMSEHVSTMGAQALQLLTLKTLGTKGMLSPQEAQSLMQPAGRIIARRVNKAVVLPNMPGDDAEDITEIALTVVEYGLRLIAQAVNAYVIRVATGSAQPTQQPRTTAPAAAPEDPTAAPMDVVLPEAPSESTSSVSAPARSQIYDMALAMGAQPYTGQD